MSEPGPPEELLELLDELELDEELLDELELDDELLDEFELDEELLELLDERQTPQGSRQEKRKLAMTTCRLYPPPRTGQAVL